MTVKKPDLSAALRAVPEPETPKPRQRVSKVVKEPSEPSESTRGRPDRKETVMIGGHFSKAFKQQLRMIAAEEDTTSQALLEEALNLLFVKKGKAKL